LLSKYRKAHVETNNTYDFNDKSELGC
jgi:hypothetical protein